jgi:hypothetical protein
MIVTGRLTVPVVGVPVVLATCQDEAEYRDFSANVRWGTLTALPTNGDRIAIGDRYARAASGSLRGLILNAGEKMKLDGLDLSELWVDAAIANNGVSLMYEPVGSLPLTGRESSSSSCSCGA